MTTTSPLQILPRTYSRMLYVFGPRYEATFKVTTPIFLVGRERVEDWEEFGTLEEFGAVWSSLEEFGGVWRSLEEFGAVWSSWSSLNEFGEHLRE
jgi:hypothetical protein